MHFDLSTLFTDHPYLSCLEDPFTHDKSPGADGWPIIKQDFNYLCDAFHSGDICLQSSNGSHTTLIPKVDGATKPFDFRPISLLNISVKIITNLLANRLQRVTMSLFYENQYKSI